MERKWVQVSKGSGSEELVNLCTFNTLAQTYTNGKYFPYASHTSLTRTKRLSNVSKQIHSLNPDVICLQEVDSDLIEPFWRKTVSTPMDYTLFYVKRPFKKDSEVIMWKNDLFEPVPLRIDEGDAPAWIKVNGANKFHVEFDDFPECRLSPKDKTASADGKTTATSCIAISAVLKHKKSNAIFVFTAIHVYWKWMFPDVQFAQISKAVELSEALVSLVKKQYPDDSAKYGVFSTVAGDMNADVNAEAYLNAKKKFPHSVYEEWPPEAKGAGYTNYTTQFKGWLDHILWFDAPEFPLALDAVVNLPTDKVLSEESAIPNSKFGSDHIPVMVRFRIPEPKIDEIDKKVIKLEKTE